MQSKAHYSFSQKMDYFDDDIELIDVLRDSVLEGDLHDNTTPHILNRVSPSKHSHLARRKNSKGSRELVMNHLRNTLYSSYVKDIYEELTEYLRNILKHASLSGFDSRRLVGEHSFKTEANHLLSLGSWEDVCKYVSDSVFQLLENERSTLSLLKSMKGKLGLNIEQRIIDNALPYLETRHLLVHADGKINSTFRSKYPNIPIKGKFVFLDYNFIISMRVAVKELAKAYDKEIIDRNLLSTQHIRK